MPTLEWIGKNKVVNHHQEVPFRVLERQYSFDEQGQHIENNGSENMIIHGDNLEALKALLPQYEGKVKCIYIDPPYNTGNEGWCYNDNVSDPHIQKWLGEVVGKEGEDLTRHDKWLCMMYPRLMLLQKLLADDGVIFISIDDTEQSFLRLICDEIFGINNFLANIAWEKRYTRSNNAKLFYSLKDSILCYRKSNELSVLKEARTAKADSNYANPDNDPRGEWMTASYVNPATKEARPNLSYEIHSPDGRTIVHPTHAWKYSYEEHLRHVKENRLWWGNDGTAKFPRLKLYKNEMPGMVPVDLWNYKDTGTTDDGGNTIKSIFGKLVFDTPKPVTLIERMIKMFSDDHNAGFTDQDYRAQEETPVPAPLPAAQQTTFIVTPPVPAEEPQDIFDDPDTVRLDPVCVNSTTEPQKIAPAVQNILAQAGKEIVAFETALQQHKDDPASDLPQEAQKMVGQTKVKAEFSDEIEQLILPKFCLKIPQSILMPSDTQELTKENLLSNFTLKGKPSNIDFDHLDNNLAQVDLDGDGTPRASKMESQYQQFIGQQFPLMPGENRLKLCRNIIHTTLSRQKKLNAVDDTELQRYVDYIIDGMNQDQLDALEQMPVNFANKICDYIIKLQEETARENFYNWLEVGKIVTEPRFKLTSHITLSGKASSLTKSLYKQECELDDNFEYDMAMALTGIDSVRWWHRNPTSGRNAFCLNAFRNHYPDFIVMTNSGKVLLVETKGDQLENAESREKIKLGRAWQNAAGSQYRYYMVFQNKDLHLEGAYRFDEFLKILGELQTRKRVTAFWFECCHSFLLSISQIK